MTFATNDDYSRRVELDGGACPACESVDLDTGQLERRGISLYARVRCGACGLEYEERYRVAGYALLPEVVVRDMPFVAE